MATGDLTLYNARRAFPTWNKVIVTADGTPVGLNGPCVLGSIHCIVAGTIVAAHNSVGVALGTNLVPNLAMTARQRIDFAGGSGIRLTAGLFLDITGGTFMVLFAPSS